LRGALIKQRAALCTASPIPKVYVNRNALAQGTPPILIDGGTPCREAILLGDVRIVHGEPYDSAEVYVVCDAVQVVR
jgi:hypothetical protein